MFPHPANSILTQICQTRKRCVCPTRFFCTMFHDCTPSKKALNIEHRFRTVKRKRPKQGQTLSYATSEHWNRLVSRSCFDSKDYRPITPSKTSTNDQNSFSTYFRKLSSLGTNCNAHLPEHKTQIKPNLNSIKFNLIST